MLKNTVDIANKHCLDSIQPWGDLLPNHLFILLRRASVLTKGDEMNIAIVDDRRLLAEAVGLLQPNTSKEGIVECFPTAEQFRLAGSTSDFDHAIINLSITGQTPLAELLQDVKGFVSSSLILLTDKPNEAERNCAKEQGAKAYIHSKYCSISDIYRAIYTEGFVSQMAKRQAEHKVFPTGSTLNKRLTRAVCLNALDRDTSMYLIGCSAHSFRMAIYRSRSAANTNTNK